MIWTVYLLRSPSGEPMYVGLTARTMADRLRAHLQSREPSDLGRWVRLLREDGEAPTIETLQVLDGFTQRAAAEIVETAWIDRLRADGFGLLNRNRVAPAVSVLDGMPDADRGAA